MQCRQIQYPHREIVWSDTNEIGLNRVKVSECWCSCNSNDLMYPMLYSIRHTSFVCCNGQMCVLNTLNEEVHSNAINNYEIHIASLTL